MLLFEDKPYRNPHWRLHALLSGTLTGFTVWLADVADKRWQKRPYGFALCAYRSWLNAELRRRKAG